jgi:hypothetical protein
MSMLYKSVGAILLGAFAGALGLSIAFVLYYLAVIPGFFPDHADIPMLFWQNIIPLGAILGSLTTCVFLSSHYWLWLFSASATIIAALVGWVTWVMYMGFFSYYIFKDRRNEILAFGIPVLWAITIALLGVAKARRESK